MEFNFQIVNVILCFVVCSPMLGMTIGDMIDFAAKKYKDAEAFVAPFQNIRRTFRQIQQDVSKILHDLQIILSWGFPSLMNLTRIRKR